MINNNYKHINFVLNWVRGTLQTIVLDQSIYYLGKRMFENWNHQHETNNRYLNVSNTITNPLVLISIMIHVVVDSNNEVSTIIPTPIKQ